MDEDEGQAPLERYLDSLRARLPAGEFIVLMRAFHALPRGGDPAARLDLAAHERELFTPEVRGALLTLIRLAAAPSAPALPIGE